MSKRSNGEGTIVKTASGTFRAQVSIQGQRTGKTFKTRKEAVDWLKDLRGQVDRGLKMEGMKTPFSAVLDDWLAIKKTQRRQATIEQYERCIQAYIKPQLGTLPMSSLNAAVFQGFYNRQLAKGSSKRLVQLLHIILHGVLKYALRLGYVTNNWTEMTEAPRPEKNEMRIWNESQVSQFMLSGPDLIYRMALTTGMRRGELLGLQWNDLDWRTGTISVKRQVYELKGGGWRFQEPKTARGRRSIKLGANILAALREHYNQAVPLTRAIAGDAWQEYDLIFPSAKGKPLCGADVSKGFRKTLTLAGLPEIRLHDCRHTCASLMLMHGIPPVKVAAILGDSLAILLSTYAHYIDGGTDKSADLMDSITTPTSIEIPLHAVAPSERV